MTFYKCLLMIKKTFLLTVALIILIFIGAWAGINFTDFNQYKKDIEQDFFKKTGYKLHIKGSILVTPLPLKISLTDLHIDNQASFATTPFAQISALHFKLSAWQLLVHKKLMIETITIHRADLFLQSNQTKNTNWQGLSTLLQPTLNPWQLKHFLVEDSAVHWLNTDTLQNWALTNLNLTAIDLLPNKKTNLITDFQFITSQNKAIYHAEISSKIEINKAINQLHLTDWHGKLHVTPATSRKLADLQFKTNATAINLDLKNQQLSIINANLSGTIGEFSTSFNANFKHDFQSEGKFNGREIDLKAWFNQLEIPLPTALADNQQNIDEVAFNWHQQKQQFALKQLKLNWGESQLQGQLTLNNLLNNPPNINFDLQINKLKLKVANLLPLLHKTKLQGKLKIEKLNAFDVKLSAVNTNLTHLNGQLYLAPLDATLYQGTLRSKLAISLTEKPTYKWSGKISQVNLHPLLTDGWQYPLISGKYDGQFRLATQGINIARLKKNLQGQFSAKIFNGNYQSKNIHKILLKQPPLQSDSTPFKALILSGKIYKGIFNVQKLNLKAKQFTAIGSGTYNLHQNIINVKLHTQHQGLLNETPIKIQGKPTQTSWKVN